MLVKNYLIEKHLSPRKNTKFSAYQEHDEKIGGDLENEKPRNNNSANKGIFLFHLLKHLSVDKTANYIKMKLPKYPCTDGQSLIMRL